MKKLKQISTGDLLTLIGQEDFKLLDIRSINAYNGWRLKNEQRGGHIKDAKSFPAAWLNHEGWTDIAKNKNILPDNKIIIYGYDLEEINKAAEKFFENGYPSISVYPNFIDEWSGNNSLPMENLPKFKYLVPPEWVHALIENKKPAEYENDKFIICHAHYRNSYRKFLQIYLE